MDKLLLAAFLSALAGFLTAIISIVKLVNEKEGKISDYRQAWNDSLRKSFADLTSKLYAMSVNSEEQARHLELIVKHENRLKTANEVDKGRLVSSIERAEELLSQTQDDILVKRHDLYLSYAFTKLHFKPHDVGFSRVEQKYDLVSSLMDELNMKNSQEKRNDLRAKMKAHIGEIVEISRDILKTEWEIVKAGEPAYKQTKIFSIWGGLLMLLILFTIGLYAFLVVAKKYEDQLQSESAKVSQAASISANNQCWHIQNVLGKPAKFNSCTGEIAEITPIITLNQKNALPTK